jgi:uncharacterized membrane protein
MEQHDVQAKLNYFFLLNGYGMTIDSCGADDLISRPQPTSGAGTRQADPRQNKRWTMIGDQTHAFVDQLAKLLELVGVAIILGGIIIASYSFFRHLSRTSDWPTAYQTFRANIGRGILLGLELLVGADIISTITAPLTTQSVGLLAGIVVIRTFLSFSLETEIEGCWPWQRAARKVSLDLDKR